MSSITWLRTHTNQSWAQNLHELSEQGKQGSIQDIEGYIRIRTATTAVPLSIINMAGIISTVVVGVCLLRQRQLRPTSLSILSLSMLTANMVYVLLGLPWLLLERVFH